jgi:two-component system phosphate regulon response regulator PhoB/two-component system alkaline phosphatase synthesis response regulator PhoP
VLVADDDEDVLELISLQLERGNIDVIQARDGEQALAMTQERDPDLVVLDVMMPGLNGYEVVKRLRAEEETGNLPVILVTARAGGGDAQHGFQVGADDYIKKPFSPAELSDRVETLLRRRRSGDA